MLAGACRFLCVRKEWAGTEGGTVLAGDRAAAVLARQGGRRVPSVPRAGLSAPRDKEQECRRSCSEWPAGVSESDSRTSSPGKTSPDGGLTEP